MSRWVFTDRRLAQCLQGAGGAAGGAAGAHGAVAELCGLIDVVGGERLGLGGGEAAFDEVAAAAAVEGDVDEADAVAAVLAPDAPLWLV